MNMNAKQRAARVATEIQHSRAIAETARGVTLTELGVRVKGNEVWKLPKWASSRYLGPLTGACAGIMDLKPASDAAFLASAVIGLNAPRVGTIFVAFEDGTRHEQPLRQGTRAQMQKVDAAVARFNAMADAANG